jgi:hypothetical protein
VVVPPPPPSSQNDAHKISLRATTKANVYLV